ncbi:MHO_1590 family protein [Mycoplasma tauri]|uniref:Uncharacterized protein n=1 Tax=Mycoplasma tauri TaxID=547987 RepID=A0A953T9L0_9MOLU|nr:hypothetical protein [Mycoplasma tauri]MBZ4195374.1 hypothetical protein [Mycoplasma tauri]MBZ4203513.1 hypothetical protein [Mycoplasma tauri]QSB07550.1 hypothetical protein JS510_00230 [Mycoplasma tauri]
MNSKTRKILIAAGSIMLASAVIAPVIVISLKKDKKTQLSKAGDNSMQNQKAPLNKNYNSENEGESLSLDIEFPNIDTNEYYSFIKIENDLAYFDKNVAPVIITDIIKKIKEPFKNIEFDYEFGGNNTILTIFIKVNQEDNKSSNKNYILKIVKDVNFDKIIVK